jgi:hypothetical protein
VVPGRQRIQTRRRVHLTRRVALLALLCSIIGAAPAQAAVTSFGSALSVPATLNTAEDLAYQGTNTAVLPSPEAPNGVVHTYHFGADTALWNVVLANGQASAPSGGQALKISLEGCAQPAADGLPPLTQIHFQDLSPLADGGAKVNLTSQPFDIPVCGHGGAGASTVTTYEPSDMCVNKGDYMDLNDEGGFVEHSYQSGVPYQVFGSVAGSNYDSFIKGGGTGNGATLSALESTAMDGFAANEDAELMLRVTFGTGPDAAYICPGGTRGLPPVPPPVNVGPQTDGINHHRVVAVAIYCRLTPECKGVATLTALGKHVSYGSSTFSLKGEQTAHVPIRVTSHTMTLIREHRGLSATLSVLVAGKTATQTIAVKIL